MAAFCVLVKGPCRGKMCDFWARVKLRKLSIDEIVQELQDFIIKCEDEVDSDLNDAFIQYWSDFGIKDFKLFCDEEPELCSKMRDAEAQLRILLL